MGTYFEEARERTRWDSGQAILHRESVETQKERNNQKENEAYSVRNSYGNLRYLKKDKKRGENKEGFVLEAFEAPGTPVHTEKEKHLDRKNMKRVRRVGKQTLYSSEVPFQNQAFFLDMAGSKRSTKFVNYMKELLRKGGHRTLRDTFGFLDQETERQELEVLKAEQKDYLSSEYRSEEKEETPGKRIDTLNSRLLRKEAKERQLRTELQLMLEERAREEARQNKLEAEQQAKEKKEHSDSEKKNIRSIQNVSETPLEGETEEDSEDTESEI